MYVMENKICRKCGFTKKLDEFEKDGKYKYKDGTVKIKYKSDCKECRKGCRNEYYVQKYEENKEEINAKRREILECECGCLIQKKHLSQHKKTIKHSELLKTKNTQKAEDPNKFSMCCNVELTEIYKKCECRRCEDWGGCKHINGYYFSICPKCDKDFGIIKTVYWEPDIGHGVY
jgi:hypothetical protein